jgi:hypothetical protein
MKLKHNVLNNERIFPSHSVIGLLAQSCHSAVKETLIKYLFDNKQSSIFCRSAIYRSMACVQPQGGRELLTNKGQKIIC